MRIHFSSNLPQSKNESRENRATMRSLYCLVMAVLLAYSCFGQTSVPSTHTVWEPPVPEWPDDLPRPTVPKPMITTFRIASVPITLGITSLAEAQRRLGGTIGHRGDAGESLSWLCLLGSDRDQRWVLWLESGEVDGGSIGGFHLQVIDREARADSRCGSLSTAKSRIELPGGLQLGTSESDVLKLLGPVTTRFGDILIFDHEHQELLHGMEFTVTNTVSIVLHNQFVSSIQVWSTSIN